MRACVSAVAGVVLAAAAVRADVPLPPGYREPTPHVRFENLSDYPDRDFYVHYRRGDGNPYVAPPRVVPVHPGEALSLGGAGRRLADIVLLAVPRGQPGPGDGPSAQDPPGTLRTSLPAPGSVASEVLADGNVTTYRVDLAGGELKVTAVPAKQAPPESGPAGSWPGASPDPAGPPDGQERAPLPLRHVGFAVTLSLALVTAGIWVARRLRDVKPGRDDGPSAGG